MSDANKGNGGVPGDYVYCIYGGGPGSALTDLIRCAERNLMLIKGSRASGDAQAVIAHGIQYGLHLIRKNSAPKLGTQAGRGITAVELSNAIAGRLTKSYPGHPTDVIHEIMTAIATLAKCLSDAQNTHSRLLKRAGIGV